MFAGSQSHQVNICFHGIGRLHAEREPGEAQYWITSTQLQHLLDTLANRPDVAISFDDGNRSDVDVALPHLLDRGLRATFFPIAGRLSDPRSLAPAALRELTDAGMAVGSHGMWHRPWRRLTAAEAEEEFVQAREEISEAAGQPVVRAAAPLGRYDRKALAKLRQYGYTEVNTSDRRLARRGAWLQPRFSVGADETPQTLETRVAGASAPVMRARNSVAGLFKRLR